MVQLVEIASQIDESRKDNMVIGLNYDQYKVYVKQKENSTTAVYMNPWEYPSANDSKSFIVEPSSVIFIFYTQSEHDNNNKL